MAVRVILGTAFLFACFLVVSCQKELDGVVTTTNSPLPPPLPGTAQFTEHRIAKGGHSSDKNPVKAVTITEMKFIVRFDSSAIYQSLDTNNQRDINKLYGFSDNNEDHHTNSARIGWRWYNNELQLFGYNYNNTAVKTQFIKAVSLNKDINCAIKVAAGSYIFNVDGTQVTMTRTAPDPQAVGYQLYPYFGGDEVAPHDIIIRVKDL
jgi:hypothetical protein